MAAKNKAGRSLVEAAAFAGAVIIMLPGAAPAPVKQGRTAGRLPNSVGSLRRHRVERSTERRLIELQAQLDFVRAAKAENYEEFKRDTAAQKEIQKRLDASCAVYSELSAHDDKLVHELRQMGAHPQSYAEFLTAKR